MNVKAERDQTIHDVLDLVFGRIGMHYDNHLLSSFSFTP